MGDRHNSLCFEQKHRLLGVAVDTAKPEEWKLTANIETSTHPPEGVRGMKVIRAFFCVLKHVLLCKFVLCYLIICRIASWHLLLLCLLYRYKAS